MHQSASRHPLRARMILASADEPYQRTGSFAPSRRRSGVDASSNSAFRACMTSFAPVVPAATDDENRARDQPCPAGRSRSRENWSCA